MATYLFAQGMDPVELAEDESFNKARHRGNGALKTLEDYRNGNIDGETKGQEFDPLHSLSFKTVNDDGSTGRICISPEKLIGFGSTEEKD